MPPIRLLLAATVLTCGLPAAAQPSVEARGASARMLVCQGTVERAGAKVQVQVRIQRPVTHDRMLALVDRGNGMAQQLIRPQVGEGTIELTETVRGTAGSPKRYPFIEVRAPESPAGTPLVGIFFAGDLNPAVLRADLWDTPTRFTLDNARDAAAVVGSCD